MLLLTRTAGQSIMIGDDINIKVLSNDFRGVRIGIEAPKEIPVHRQEIYQRIQREKLSELQNLNGGEKDE